MWNGSQHRSNGCPLPQGQGCPGFGWWSLVGSEDILQTYRDAARKGEGKPAAGLTPGPPRVETDRSMRKPTAEERKHRCTRKRRYRTPGDALDAALVAGVAGARTAYRCPLCGLWHLTSK